MSSCDKHLLCFCQRTIKPEREGMMAGGHGPHGRTFSSLCVRSTMEDCETFVKSAKHPRGYSIGIEAETGVRQNARGCDCVVNSSVLHLPGILEANGSLGAGTERLFCVTENLVRIFSFSPQSGFVPFCLSGFSSTFQSSTKTSSVRRTPRR